MYMESSKFKKTLIAFSVACVIQEPLSAAIIEVSPSCSLVDAFLSAENDLAINSCDAGSGADTIILDTNLSHTLELPFDNNGDLTTGLPEIRSTITVQGNGATVSRDVNSESFRIFRIVGQGDLTVEGLSVLGGTTIENRLEESGGCFLVEDGANLTIRNSTVSECRVGTIERNPLAAGGAVAAINSSTVLISGSNFNANSAYSGGALEAMTSSTISVADSTLERNGATYGGAVTARTGSIVSISDSTLTENGGYSGGALFAEDATVTIARSDVSRTGFSRGTITVSSSNLEVSDSFITRNGTFSNGRGLYSGGIESRASTMTIINTEISNNTVNYFGGGISVLGGVSTIINSTIANNVCAYRNTSGGGILVFGGELSIANTTISGNVASTGFRGQPGDGGGIANIGGRVEILNSTVYGNRAYEGGGISNERGGEITLKNTIIGGENMIRGQSDRLVNQPLCFLDDGAINAGADSILQGGSCDTDALNLDPMVGELQLNGGSTRTHALLPGSPAINIGLESFCSSLSLSGRDQRGRFHLESCDAGSFEFEGLISLTPSSNLIGPLFLLLDDDDD